MTTQLNLFSARHLYFAYGSNLQIDQMLRRCPSATVEGAAKLHGYRLGFAGFSVSRGGAGVATVVEDKNAWTSGVVFEIDQADLDRLDRFEGHPFAYCRSTQPIYFEDGGFAHCHVYIKDDVENLPTEDYALALWRGYREHGLDFEPLLDALESANNAVMLGA